MKSDIFTEAYNNLNTAQKQAVDALEGPVMVVAGPGTGKTQVLALRIANILQKTDTPANGILALTFTRAGVKAMRERLAAYVGPRAREVTILTFHSFALSLIEKHYQLLDFDAPPVLLDEQHTVALIDELLEQNEWKHIRPRGDVAKYFADLRSLVSLMKREGLSPEQFIAAIDEDIAVLKESPESISSRGATKGRLKKEVVTKLESLERTREVVAFYEAYESLKRARRLFDYDDALRYAVELVEMSEDVCNDIRENYLYVLVDEHQDSSGVQNSFLKAVWKEVDQPNIFVVGDDRQLIYGFGGAKRAYFEDFKTAFGKAVLITLVENYRSTAPILTLADTLLKSTLTADTLRSNRAGDERVRLLEYAYARDEIIAAGAHFKKAIETGTPAHECALLVPKNSHIRTAVHILRDMGLPIRSVGNVSLFSLPEMEKFCTVLRAVANPHDGVALSKTLFDPLTRIPPLAAHAFLQKTKVKELSVQMLVSYGAHDTLFTEQNHLVAWGNRLSEWIILATHEGVEPLLHQVGNDFLINTATDHDILVRRVELLRTVLHLVGAWTAEHPKGTLRDFLAYLDRLETYGQVLPVATLRGGEGINVLTLHGSKGLEFDTVWIAHLNESVLMSQKRLGFTLPTMVEQLMEDRNREVATREVYVAITRAKKQCTISYARASVTDTELELAHLIADLPDEQFEKKLAEETEAELVALSPTIYIAKQRALAEQSDIQKLVETVREEYGDRKVSVTLLNNFFECPWKWYFRNLLRLPEQKLEQQLFGSAVHGALEKVLKNEIAPSEDEVSTVVAQYLEKEGITEPATLGRLSKEGTSAVLAWVSHYLPSLAKDHVAERSLSYKDPQFPHLTLYGKIDLTERFPDGTIAVTDFKTGSPKTTGAIEKRDEEGRLSSPLRQLAMYSYLIKGAEKKEVAACRLLYIEENPAEKNALYTTQITDEEVALLKKDIADYDDFVRSGTWVERPCQYNSFGKHTECGYCKQVKEMYLGNHSSEKVKRSQKPLK